MNLSGNSGESILSSEMALSSMFMRLGTLRKNALAAMQAKEAAQAEENDRTQAAIEAASEDEEELENAGDDEDDNAIEQSPEQPFYGQDDHEYGDV